METANEGINVLVITNSMIIGLLISLFGGIVSAGHTYSKERRKVPPTMDWIDVLLLIISGCFSGVIGYLIADWKLDSYNLIWASAGICAIGGYAMLVAIKDIGLDVLRSRLDSNNDNSDGGN